MGASNGFNSDGKLAWWEAMANLFPTVGFNQALDAIFVTRGRRGPADPLKNFSKCYRVRLLYVFHLTGASNSPHRSTAGDGRDLRGQWRSPVQFGPRFREIFEFLGIR